MSCRLTSDKATVPCHTCDQYQCITRPSTPKLDRSTKSNIMSRASLALCVHRSSLKPLSTQVKYFVNSSYNTVTTRFYHVKIMIIDTGPRKSILRASDTDSTHSPHPLDVCARLVRFHRSKPALTSAPDGAVCGAVPRVASVESTAPI